MSLGHYFGYVRIQGVCSPQARNNNAKQENI